MKREKNIGVLWRERERERRGKAMRKRGVSTLLLLFFFFFFSINFVPSALAIWLTVPSTGTKCVSEEIQHNVVVLADYVVIPSDHSKNPTLAVKVPFFPFILAPFSDLFPGSLFNCSLLSFLPNVYCLIFNPICYLVKKFEVQVILLP